ncbi:hypothetical protein [Nocardia sp. NPDC004604]
MAATTPRQADSTTSNAATMNMPMDGSHKPVTTTDADWKPVTA